METVRVRPGIRELRSPDLPLSNTVNACNLKKILQYVRMISCFEALDIQRARIDFSSGWSEMLA
jgi:hypothetical protein